MRSAATTDLSPAFPLSKRRLRSSMRAARAALPSFVRRRAAERVAQRLTRLAVFQRSRRIAFYLPNDGELDLRPAIRIAWAQGKRCYVPVLYPGRARWLRFAQLQADTTLVPDKYGILVPRGSFRGTLPAQALDLVLAPLVAFDTGGRRIGMGGGYYDRTFEYLRRRSSWHQPQLVGVAYDLQRVARIDEDIWDVALRAIVTESELYEK